MPPTALTGTVTQPKALLDDDRLNDRAANPRSALHDLWRWANDRDRDCRLQGQDIPLKRGQLARSIVTLARDWRLDRNTVKGWLLLFQEWGFITFRTTPLTTIITILDYGIFNPDTATESTAESTTNSAADPTTESTTNSAQKVEGGSRKVEAGSARASGTNEAEIPDEAEILQYAQALRDVQRAPAGIPELYARDWMARHANSDRDWPKDWRRALRLSFFNDWSNPTAFQHALAHGRTSPDTGRPTSPENRKNGGGKSVAQQSYLLDHAIRDLEARIEEKHTLDQEVPRAWRTELKALEKKRGELNARISDESPRQDL